MPSGILGKASFGANLFQNGVKWMALIGALSHRVVNSWEEVEEVILEPSSFELLLSIPLWFPFSFHDSVRGIITAESGQVQGQNNTQLSSTFSYHPRSVLWGEDHRQVSVGKASIAHPSGLFADTEPKTAHLNGTCPIVQVIGGSWPKPRSSPLSPAHSLMPSALFCLSIVDPWAVYDVALCSGCMYMGRSQAYSYSQVCLWGSFSGRWSITQGMRSPAS